VIRRLINWLFRWRHVNFGETRVDVVQNAPESYWIRRGENLVGGTPTLQELRQTRQVSTYRAIFEAIQTLGVHHVLDLGCHIAALAQLIYDWGYQGSYTGVDSNTYALKEAQKALEQQKGKVSFVQANIRSLGFADKTTLCVVMKDVLEHMEDFRPLLKEAARVSAKYVIIANFIPWTEGKTIIQRESEGFYHNLYNRQEVYNFAHDLGFRVQEIISALEKDARPNEIVVFVRN
jgi:ubiquinone/menaquinone biosynthesis C-methylase UbiE